MSELSETTNLSSQEECVLIAIIQEQFQRNEPVSKSRIDANLNKSTFYNPVDTGIALLRLAKRELIVSKMFKVDGCDQTVELYELSTSGKEWVLANEKLLNTETNSIF
ncbi:MAG: hypothetical protein KIT56_01820 [Gammaproteobacteria bacterium]|nr:hypothetical protein [Gammaproteobacteria bacterium]MCW5582622.1 hypothetical protein [Gammaproteobacteria bacterium]